MKIKQCDVFYVLFIRQKWFLLLVLFFSLLCGAEMKPGASLVPSNGRTTELCPALTLRKGATQACRVGLLNPLRSRMGGKYISALCLGELDEPWLL